MVFTNLGVSEEVRVRRQEAVRAAVEAECHPQRLEHKKNGFQSEIPQLLLETF